MTFKVTLTDFTGRGTTDERWYAARKLIVTKNTRVAKNRDYAAEVARMDDGALMSELEGVAMSIRSSWECVTYDFKIEGISRACCDQMTRSRVGCGFAVMAQRVVDNSQFNYVVPDTVRNARFDSDFHAHMATVQKFYQMMIERGIPAQDARSVLPMAAESPLSAWYNLRSLAGIVAKRQNLRAQGEYVAVAAAMKAAVLAVHPWVEMFLDPPRLRTPNLDAILRDVLGDRSPVENKRLNDALKELDNLKGTWD